MTTEDYVSYPIALALKKAGFDWPCEAFYEHIDGKMWLSVDGKEDWNSGVDYSAPTLWQAQKWLREKKRFDIEIRVWLVDVEREYRPYIMPPKCKDFIAYPPEKSYEAALSAGIEAALELIDKKGE